MPASQMRKVIHQLQSTLLLHEASDGQLLEHFISRHENAALEVLVRRHGPMVWGVCRRILVNHQDAEDAFQATFLVLVRKAASIVPREMIGNWLYGVAHQTALKARATTAKRKKRESQVTTMPEASVTDQDVWSDLQPLLDRELSKLPDKYRVVILLCDLEGKTRKEAARQIGCPEGTVATRLARGRGLLAKRLGRHGLAVSGGSVAALLAQNASACVPASVVSSTIKAATFFAAGQKAMISVEVIALTQGVLKTMLLTKLKTVLTMGLMLGIIAFGGGLVTYYPARAQDNVEKLRADAKKGEVPLKEEAGGDHASPKNVRFTAEQNAAKEDANKLQGVWEVVSVIHQGKKAEWKHFDGQVWVFNGNTLLGISKSTYVLNASETPKAFDVTRKGRRSGEVETTLGIYELKGDDLKIAFHSKSEERPKEFESTEQNLTTLHILKRIKLGK